MRSEAPIGTTTERSRTAIVVALFAVLLVAALREHLLGSVLAIVGVYALVSALVRALSARVPARWVRPLALLVTILIVAAIAWAAFSAAEWRVREGNVASLADLLAGSLDRLRSSLPAWLGSKIPPSVDDAQAAAATALRAHAQNVERWGQHLARGAAHGFIAVVVGLLAALEQPLASSTPWMESARRRAQNFRIAFAEIVSAQVRISAINTALTAVFVFGALPVAGIHLPLASTLVGFSFVAGLVPIVGNLASNAAILLAALTVSPAAAVAALVFLLIVHKLEYVLNARLVGGRTSVPASMLLACMVLMEALFGIAGLVAAPIYCAWAFRELRDLGVL